MYIYIYIYSTPQFETFEFGANAEKKQGYISIRLAPRCDVTAEGAPERLADFSIFNMADNFYTCILNYFSTLSQ